MVLSSSIRTGKKSDRVALYFMQYIQEHKLGDAELIDLDAYQFPLFEERLKLLKTPPGELAGICAKN